MRPALRTPNPSVRRSFSRTPVPSVFRALATHGSQLPEGVCSPPGRRSAELHPGNREDTVDSDAPRGHRGRAPQQRSREPGKGAGGAEPSPAPESRRGGQKCSLLRGHGCGGRGDSAWAKGRVSADGAAPSPPTQGARSLTPWGQTQVSPDVIKLLLQTQITPIVPSPPFPFHR